MEKLSMRMNLHFHFYYEKYLRQLSRMTGRIVHSFKYSNRLEIVVKAILSASIFLDNLSNFFIDNINAIELKIM